MQNAHQRGIAFGVRGGAIRPLRRLKAADRESRRLRAKERLEKLKLKIKSRTKTSSTTSSSSKTTTPQGRVLERASSSTTVAYDESEFLIGDGESDNRDSKKPAKPKEKARPPKRTPQPPSAPPPKRTPQPPAAPPPKRRLRQKTGA